MRSILQRIGELELPDSCNGAGIILVAPLILCAPGMLAACALVAPKATCAAIAAVALSEAGAKLVNSWQTHTTQKSGSPHIDHTDHKDHNAAPTNGAGNSTPMPVDEEDDDWVITADPTE